MAVWDDIGDAFDAAKRVATKVVDGLGEVIVSSRTIIIDGVNDVGKGLKTLVHGALGIRQLRGHEIALADRVFKGTIPYHRVVIISIKGLGDRPFCLPGNI